MPHERRVVDVDEERAAARAVGGGREVERLGAAHRRLHRARRLRQHLEPLRHRVPGARHRDLGGLDQLRALGEVQRRVAAHRVEDRGEVVGADDLGAQRAVLVGELGDLRQPEVVDLLRGAGGGRVVAQQCVVGRLPAGHGAQAARLVGPGVRQHLVAQHVAVGGHRRVHLGVDDRGHPPPPRGGVDVARGRGQCRHDRRLVQRQGQLGVDLVGRPRHRERGGDATGGDSLAQPLGELVIASAPRRRASPRRRRPRRRRAARASRARSARRPAGRRSGRRRARPGGSRAGRRSSSTSRSAPPA